MNPLLLSIDTGLATGGAALLDLHSKQVIDVLLLTTEKSVRKREVSVSSDTMNRAKLYARALQRFIAPYSNIRGIVHESLSLPRNARAAALIGISLGVVADIAEQRNCPLIEVTPQNVKLGVTGKKTASKDEVIQAVLNHQPELEPAFKQRGPAGKWEHMADAVAVGLSAWDHDIVRLLRAGSGA